MVKFAALAALRFALFIAASADAAVSFCSSPDTTVPLFSTSCDASRLATASDTCARGEGGTRMGQGVWMGAIWKG